jgi:hypothetical protein
MAVRSETRLIDRNEFPDFDYLSHKKSWSSANQRLNRKIGTQKDSSTTIAPAFCVDHMEGGAVAMFTGARALGLEGSVAKDSKSPTSRGHG